MVSGELGSGDVRTSAMAEESKPYGQGKKNGRRRKIREKLRDENRDRKERKENQNIKHSEVLRMV